MEYRRIASPSECNSFTRIFDEYVESSNCHIWSDDIYADVRVFNAEKKIKEYADLYKKMLDYFCDARGRRPEYSLLMVNRVRAIPGNLGSGGGWHRDSWRNQAKTFVYLSEVSSENGPLEYLPGSGGILNKLAGYLSTGGSLRASSRYCEKQAAEPVFADPGNAFFLDTTYLHRGRPIKEGVRYAATLYTFEGSERRVAVAKSRFEDL